MVYSQEGEYTHGGKYNTRYTQGGAHIHKEAITDEATNIVRREVKYTMFQSEDIHRSDTTKRGCMWRRITGGIHIGVEYTRIYVVA